MAKTKSVAIVHRKSTAVDAIAEQVVEVDVLPVMDNKAVQILTAKREHHAAVIDTITGVKRDIMRIEQEIIGAVGAKMQELKMLKKRMKDLQKLSERAALGIHETQMDALYYVPGKTLEEKKQYLLLQKQNSRLL